MFISMDRLVKDFGVHPKSILHIGAHLGEEAVDYANTGVEKVLWIEGNPALMQGLQQNIRNYPGQTAENAVISDKDNAASQLYLTTFSMASSILPLKRHLDFYPSMTVTQVLEVTTTTIDTLLSNLNIDPTCFDMANLDIEGAELLALYGMETVIPSLKWIYSEVNIEEMYEDCVLLNQMDDFLNEHGFKRIALEYAYINQTFCGFADGLWAR